MPLTSKGKKIMKSMEETYGKKKAKSVFYASINKGKIKGAEKLKPIKAFTGLEIALLTGAGTLAASELLKEKPKQAIYNDPFKNITGPNVDASKFVSDATNVNKVTSNLTNPTTSTDESMQKQIAEQAVNPDEDTKTMKRGGQVRGVRIAQRGFKNIRVV